MMMTGKLNLGDRKFDNLGQLRPITDSQEADRGDVKSHRGLKWGLNAAPPARMPLPCHGAARNTVHQCSGQHHFFLFSHFFHFPLFKCFFKKESGPLASIWFRGFYNGYRPIPI